MGKENNLGKRGWRIMAGGTGTGKIKKKKKETKEQIRWEAMDWLLCEVFKILEEINNKINKLIDWKRATFLMRKEDWKVREFKYKIEGECKHEWIYSDEYDIWECIKCGKEEPEKPKPPKGRIIKESGKIVIREKECDHKWKYLAQIKKENHIEILYECHKCWKTKTELECRHDWECMVDGAKVKIYRCRRCGEKKRECVHSWMPVDTAVSLEDLSRKFMYFRCDNCGELKSEELTDELLYKLVGFCSNHKWVKESEVVNCESWIIKRVYKCSICGGMKTEIECKHKWERMGGAGCYEGNYSDPSSLHWVNAWRYKCKMCGEEKTEKVEAGKYYNALLTEEQIKQYCCNHNWVLIGTSSSSEHAMTENESLCTILKIDYIYECSKCGERKVTDRGLSY